MKRKQRHNNNINQGNTKKLKISTPPRKNTSHYNEFEQDIDLDEYSILYQSNITEPKIILFRTYLQDEDKRKNKIIDRGVSFFGTNKKVIEDTYTGDHIEKHEIPIENLFDLTSDKNYSVLKDIYNTLDDNKKKMFDKCLKDYNGQYYRISKDATDDIKFAELLQDKLPQYEGSYTKKKENPGFTNNNTDVLKHAEVIIWDTNTLQKIFDFKLNSDKILFVRGKGRELREKGTEAEKKARNNRQKSIKTETIKKLSFN